MIFSSVQVAKASSYPEGCTSTTKFSATTGRSCTPQPCQPGDLYNFQTGQRCGAVSYLPGCASGYLYSVTTGQRCDNPNITVVPPDQQTGPVTTPAVTKTNLQIPTFEVLSDSPKTIRTSSDDPQVLATFTVKNTSINTPLSLLGLTVSVSSGQAGDNFPTSIGISGGEGAMGLRIGSADQVIDNAGGSETVALAQRIYLGPWQSQKFSITVPGKLKQSLAGATIKTELKASGTYDNNSASAYGTGMASTTVTY